MLLSQSFGPMGLLQRGLLRRFGVSPHCSRAATACFSSQPSAAEGKAHAAAPAATHAAEQHHDSLSGLYNMPQDHSHHGDPRKWINPDGTYQYPMTPHAYHHEDPYSNVPKQHIVSVAGRKMIKGEETRSLVELFSIHQLNMPFFPRMRVRVYGNHDLLMKAEFLFFWTPTFIIWSLTIPVFTMLYMVDEAVYTAMTVKVIGRQWYWIYEVESPVD